MSNSERKFVADVMLGRLARWLRLLGCDVFYDDSGEDNRLLAIALAEKRTLLTRDVALAERVGDAGYLVEAEGTEKQLAEVIEAFDVEPILYGDRCPNCNGAVVEAPKESVEGDVPRYTYLTHDIFQRCGDCGQIFWEGSHRELAERDLERILSDYEDK